MPGSNPSAASEASTDPGGMPRHPLFAVCLHKLPIGRGIKALNPGGCGGKAPAGRVAHTFLLRAHSHNAYGTHHIFSHNFEESFSSNSTFYYS